MAETWEASGPLRAERPIRRGARAVYWPREWPSRAPHLSPQRAAISPPFANPTKFLVTVDRDCRKIFSVDRARGTCEPVAELEQRLDGALEGALSPDARAWNRGLKTIRVVEGGYVVCDIFSVYRLDPDFRIVRHLSIPRFMDIHSAIPYGETLLVCNTGADQALRVDWEGTILESIDLHRWFPATPWMERDLDTVNREHGGDLRLMPLDWARESCHVNWAEETPLGTMLSCFIQGEAIFFRGGRPELAVKTRAKMHAPRYLEATRTILYCASEDNVIAETTLDGREIWAIEGFQFAKHADLLPNGNIIIADTGNQRIVEFDRGAGRVVWEIAVPGTPYDVEPVP